MSTRACVSLAATAVGAVLLIAALGAGSASAAAQSDAKASGRGGTIRVDSEVGLRLRRSCPRVLHALMAAAAHVGSS